MNTLSDRFEKWLNRRNSKKNADESIIDENDLKAPDENVGHTSIQETPEANKITGKTFYIISSKPINQTI